MLLQNLHHFNPQPSLLLLLIKTPQRKNRMHNMIFILPSTKPNESKESFNPAILLTDYSVWTNKTKEAGVGEGVRVGERTLSTEKPIGRNSQQSKYIILQYMTMNKKEARVGSGGRWGKSVRQTDRKKSSEIRMNWNGLLVLVLHCYNHNLGVRGSSGGTDISPQGKTCSIP